MKTITRDLNHWVTLCTAKDTILSDGIMSLSRENVLSCYAQIVQRRGSMLSPDGYTIKHERGLRTHQIITRYRADVDITMLAWIYEKRLQSPPRWFKVLQDADHLEDGQFLTIDVRLVEQSEMASPPVDVIDNTPDKADILSPVAQPRTFSL